MKAKKEKGKKHALKMRVYKAALQSSSDSDGNEDEEHSDSEESHQSSSAESHGSNTSF